jgi:hypothetical protein
VLKVKPFKKSPIDNEDLMAYLARLVELMIAGDVKEGRNAAAHLEEAQAAEVAITRDLPVISEPHTSASSRALKAQAKAEAKALTDVEGDPVLVGLVDKDVGAVLLGEKDGETYVVRAVHYDERGDRKYFEATCVRVEKGGGGSWAVPLSSFEAGCEVLKGGLLVGYALMDLTDPGDPVLLSDVDVNDFHPLSQGNSGSRRLRRVEKKEKREEGRGRACRSSPSRVQRPQSDI